MGRCLRKVGRGAQRTVRHGRSSDQLLATRDTMIRARTRIFSLPPLSLSPLPLALVRFVIPSTYSLWTSVSVYIFCLSFLSSIHSFTLPLLIPSLSTSPPLFSSIPPPLPFPQVLLTCFLPITSSLFPALTFHPDMLPSDMSSFALRII